eukprot:scaffold8384_cov108-Isochrysis_galbana.AAC.3
MRVATTGSRRRPTDPPTAPALAPVSGRLGRTGAGRKVVARRTRCLLNRCPPTACRRDWPRRGS